MKRTNDFTDDSKLVAVRLPKILKRQAQQYCRDEDLTISQLLRRAVRRELSIPVREEKAAQ